MRVLQHTPACCKGSAKLTPRLRRARIETMKIAQGRVVKGSVVTRAKLPEGARVTVVAHDERRPIRLTAAEEDEVAAGIAEVEAGRKVPAARLRDRLRRR